MSILRYNLAIYQHDAEMQEDPNGEYCLFTVAEALQNVYLNKVSELELALEAERARRIKVEEVVDAVIKGTGLWGSVYSLAEEYRAQYPRVEKVEALAPNKEGQK